MNRFESSSDSRLCIFLLGLSVSIEREPEMRKGMLPFRKTYPIHHVKTSLTLTKNRDQKWDSNCLGDLHMKNGGKINGIISEGTLPPMSKKPLCIICRWSWPPNWRHLRFSPICWKFVIRAEQYWQDQLLKNEMPKKQASVLLRLHSVHNYFA